MSQLGAMGNLPGISAIIETYEAAISWGPASQLVFLPRGGRIDANATDSGASPTWKLRPGLVLGKITATGKWTNYSPTATDGSQQAGGVLAWGLRMQDLLTGTAVDKLQPIVIGGNVIGANLLGLDVQARGQMEDGGFRFDDDIPPTYNNPVFGKVSAKTANYTVVAADTGTLFTTTGAGGEVDFTLPAIGPGLHFMFLNTVAQVMKVISAEGTNIVAFNNASASSVAFSTGGAEIGGLLQVFSNPAGTKWYVENMSAGANTVTVA